MKLSYHKPLSHRDSGKNTDKVTRDLTRVHLILVHSHCQWFSGIRERVHTQPVYVPERHMTSMWLVMSQQRLQFAYELRFLSRETTLVHLFLWFDHKIAHFVPFHSWRTTPASASSLRHGIITAFVHTARVPGLNTAMLLGPQHGIDPGINPGSCLRSHRRRSANFPAISRDHRTVWKGL